MGMFDSIRCVCTLPIPGYEDRIFQTKDTPSQTGDDYEIRGDGTLWGWEMQEYPGSIDPEWVQVVLTGEVRFYDFKSPDNLKGWIEFSAWFTEGVLGRIRVVADRD